MAKATRSSYTRRGAGSRRLPILDAGRLAEVFLALQRAHGTQRAAAQRVGLTPVQFWQRCHERGGAHVTRRVFFALERELNKLIRSAERADRNRDARHWGRVRATLFEAVVSPEGADLIDAVWIPWLHDAWKAWAPRSTRRRLSFAFAVPGEKTPRDAERLHAVHRLRDYLRSRPALVSYVTPFDGLVERRAALGWYDGLCAALAVVQALDPLLHGERTGGIERGWKEMSDDELARYLKAAYICAELLLRREDVLTRAALSARRAARPRA